MSTELQTLLASRLEGFRHAPGGNGWVARCPACALEGHDKARDHLRIYPSGAFRCAKYGKDAPGSEPLDHNRIVRAHVYQDCDPLTLASLEHAIIDPEPKIEADKVYPDSMLSEMVPDYRYWVNRGISEEVLRKMEGGMHPPDIPSKMSHRFIFPIRDPSTKRIVGWSGRLTDNASFGPRWKHLCRVSRVLYPLAVTADEIKRLKKVVLVESIGDSLACFESGIWCVGILLGLNLNSRWLGWLAGAGLDEIIISTNNDAIGKPESAEAGNKAAEKLRRKLIPFFGEERVKVRLPNGAKDWNDCLLKCPEELVQFKGEIEGLAVPVGPVASEPPPPTLIL